MTDRPRLSIRLAPYNGEEYLAESAPTPCSSKTYEDFELVISDNAWDPGHLREYAARDASGTSRQPRDTWRHAEPQPGVRRMPRRVSQVGLGTMLAGRDLLRRCVEALDERPEVILAHPGQAVIDGDGQVKVPYEYTLATDSPQPAGALPDLLLEPGGDDFYGVRFSRVKPMDRRHADRTFVAEFTGASTRCRSCCTSAATTPPAPRATRPKRSQCVKPGPAPGGPASPGCSPSTSGASPRRSGGRRSVPGRPAAASATAAVSRRKPAGSGRAPASGSRTAPRSTGLRTVSVDALAAGREGRRP
ncbi:Glycosyl transferase OS=Streptomyces antimycoticus OX=68175 GN=SANT12839_020820 PE=4 SV=1 [Streptomyces antimycoticus]